MNNSTREAKWQPLEHENRPGWPAAPSRHWQTSSGALYAMGEVPRCESRTDYRVLATRRKTHTAKSASGPAKTASEPQMPGRGLNYETVATSEAQNTRVSGI